MDEQKQKKFEEFYVKFVKKCLTENMLPIVLMEYDPRGMFPVLKFRVVEEDEKQEILSSLIQEK